jgi:hypothetical protein
VLDVHGETAARSAHAGDAVMPRGQLLDVHDSNDAMTSALSKYSLPRVACYKMLVKVKLL